MSIQLIRNKGKFTLLVFAVLFASGMFLGCGESGDPGPQGPPGAGATGTDAAVQAESCATCHSEAGAEHQASYDELYQDGVIAVTNLAYAFAADPDTTTITFNMTKDGANFDCTETGDPGNSLGIYFTEYTGTSFEQAGRLSLKGDLTYDALTNQCTSTLVELDPADPDFVDYVDLSGVDGLIVLYGRVDRVGTLPARIQQVKYPFAAFLETGAGVAYASAANNDGCEKCHTDPYLKHGYIYARVADDPTNDFYTCKACHLDNGEGGHFIWQLLVDDPQLIIDLEEEYGEDWEESGDPRLDPYAYRTTLMNDVHMSHAMEFPYPQSMSNCATCHEGKLGVTLTDANFALETCKSCHPVTGSAEYGTDTFALETIIPHGFTDATDCTLCHVPAGIAPVFSEIHTGYDKVIYADAVGTKYSEVFTVTIDNATFVGDELTIQFSAAEAPDLAGLDVADIVPTVLVGLYGWDTKDYIVGPHERLFDDNDLRILLIRSSIDHLVITGVNFTESSCFMAASTICRSQIHTTMY